MSAYKDKTKKASWYCSFYYVDYLGNRKQKLKRGFATKRDALAFERSFLEQHSTEPTFTFKSLAKLFLEDYKKKTKLSSYHKRELIIELYLLPYFADIPINNITPLMVNKWFTEVQPIKTKTFSASYKNLLLTVLNSMFKFAMIYYNLSSNPCRNVPPVKDYDKKEKNFLTLEQYKAFSSNIKVLKHKLIFDLLFYTGMRIGELLALTFNDVDLENGTININKTLYFRKNTTTITPPKTLSSNRTITIPIFLVDELKEYYKKCYDKSKDTRLFIISSPVIARACKKYLLLAGLPHIRLHDFRHSHVALLVELGENPLLIAKRLGHSDIKMTLNTYAHLYPNRQKELADKLNNI